MTAVGDCLPGGRAVMLAGVAITLQRWPIVGRRAELEVFERALRSGEHAGLVIYGRAGVGKTRLADECRQLGWQLRRRRAGQHA